jgi:hypothetical protein
MTATATRHRTVTDHEPSWWLRGQLNNLLAGWQANGVHACPHVKRSRRNAAVGITALYLPEVLTCPDRRCADVFKLDGAPDHECDRCHEQSETLAAVVHDSDLDGLRLLVMFGLCPHCERKEVGR